MTKKVSAKELGNVITLLAKNFDDELFNKTEQELEENWFFAWDDALSLENNMYNFYDLLGLYERLCRRWEEMHNGSVCVVERVKKKYLMPKISEFTLRLTQHIEKQSALRNAPRQ